MSVRNLNYLFAPRSVVLIGASDKPHSVGATVLRNLGEGGFQGPLYAVNPKYTQVGGQPCYHSVAALPETPDMAIICTPADTVPGIIAELGEKGTRAAIVLSAGLDRKAGLHGPSLKQAMLDTARPYLLRILGPNCVGLLAPGIGLNGSFAHTGALPGRIAFVSQSGALVTGMLDWAKSRGIGFSRFISLGDSADVDFGDVLDYLSTDAATAAILLYVEDVRQARKFMSAARAAARSKPTLVVKSGRVPEGARAAASHTGALAGADEVYDAAIRRAGMLRVLSTEDLFDAVETLAHAKPLHGERLAIMTNGGGLGVMATDALVCGGGTLAQLSQSALNRLDGLLPPNWSHANPVDIVGDAPIERYLQTLEVLLRDEGADALLFIHAPTAIVPSSDIASALAPLLRDSGRTVLACWLGGYAVAEARHIFASAGIPVYDTPEAAVKGFLQLMQYRRNQALLMQVPPAACGDFVPDRERARAVIAEALAGGRQMLSEPESKDLLAAYGIPVVPTRTARTVHEALASARAIGYPVALKILSPDITHKSDVGGVALDLETPQELSAAAEAMERRLRAQHPQARLQGYTVQAMARRPQAVELIAGIGADPVFGPVVLFGQGGVAVEVSKDTAIGLPPLNMVLARDMVDRTRVAKLLAGYRDRPAADIDAVCGTLIRVAQLATDLGEIIELDINPLLADSAGVIALDARVQVAPRAGRNSALERLAIRPYPDELEEWVEWQGQRIQLRPVRPEDGEAHIVFFNALTPEDVRLRAFARVRELSTSQLARLTQIDYDREMAFIAVRPRSNGSVETLGVARAVSDPDNIEAEFAIIVRSDLKRSGLGLLLMYKLIAYCRWRGTQAIVGETLPDNTGLLKLARQLGFEIVRAPQEGVVRLRLALNEPQ